MVDRAEWRQKTDQDREDRLEGLYPACCSKTGGQKCLQAEYGAKSHGRRDRAKMKK